MFVFILFMGSYICTLYYYYAQTRPPDRSRTPKGREKAKTGIPLFYRPSTNSTAYARRLECRNSRDTLGAASICCQAVSIWYGWSYIVYGPSTPQLFFSASESRTSQDLETMIRPLSPRRIASRGVQGRGTSSSLGGYMQETFVRPQGAKKWKRIPFQNAISTPHHHLDPEHLFSPPLTHCPLPHCMGTE